MVDTELLAYYQLDDERWQALPVWRQDKLKEHFRDWKWRQDLSRRKSLLPKLVNHGK